MKKFHTVKLAVTAAVALSVLVPGPAPALRARENTPRDSAMVVTANLEEAWDYGDTQKHWDMDKFVTELLDDSRFKPDILAVQEVRKSSATYVAKELSRRSGQSYKVVVMPPSNPYFPYKGRAGAKETSIVINTKTMRVLSNGGYMPTVAKASHETAPHDPVFHQAYALIGKRGTDKKFAVMSVHLLPRGYLASADLDEYYRNKWVRQMHNKLRNRYGDRNGVKYLMMGDFNQHGCHRGDWTGCDKKAAFWKTLNGFGYQDTEKDFGTVDFIFSKGMPGALHGIDQEWKTTSAAKRYSDHPFRWTVLGPDRYAPTPPKPFQADLRKRPGGQPLVHVSWLPADDRAGSGVVRVVLEKKVDDGRWTTLKLERDRSHYDGEVAWKQTVRYRIRAQDRAGNYSPYLRKSVEILGENVN